jgi:Holliday junction resolvasome RuvABC ATP-dependent DNA helicase subunit
LINLKGVQLACLIATAVSESTETIEEVYEPFLIQEGFIMRTPRGREVTDKAYRHLGKVNRTFKVVFKFIKYRFL